MYYRGSGTARDYGLAAKWFRAAAEQGDARARHGLGFLYIKGWGVPTDYSEAARSERLAAEDGIPQAQADLAYLYESGRGVPLDSVAAYGWYSRAIAGGDKTSAERRKNLSRIMTKRQLDAANVGPQAGIVQAATAFHTRHGRLRAARKPLIYRSIRQDHRFCARQRIERPFV